MAHRYFIRLAYNGAPFHGWQSQPNAVSVQQMIEEALSRILREPIAIVGAGRTDAGVNAAMMIAHFDSSREIDDVSSIIRSLNSILGRDIAIYAISPVAEDAHARFDATARSYKYYVHTRKSPFLYSHSCYIPYPVDFEAMNRAAKELYRYTDFTSFSKLHTDVATNNCKVTHAQWSETTEGEWVFTITADRFLRNMVRAIVGTLFEVGRGKITVEQFCEIIESKNRCNAGTSVIGEALFLWEIRYPYPI